MSPWDHLGSPWAPPGSPGLPKSGKRTKTWFVAHPKGAQREAKRVQKVTKTRSKVEKMMVEDQREEKLRPQCDLGGFFLDLGLKKLKNHIKLATVENELPRGKRSQK